MALHGYDTRLAKRLDFIQKGSTLIMEDRIKALQKTVDTMKDEKEESSFTATPKLGVFHGYPSEDVQLWIDRFNRLAIFYTWSDNKCLHAMELYLRGPAEAWAKSVDKDHENKSTFEKFRSALILKFTNTSRKFLLDTQFHDRVMKPEDTVESFLLSLQEMGQKLGHGEDQVLSQFLRGLSSTIKTTVLTQTPETLSRACQLAMVAETVQTDQRHAEQSALQGDVTRLGRGLQTLYDKMDEIAVAARRPSWFEKHANT